MNLHGQQRCGFYLSMELIHRRRRRPSVRVGRDCIPRFAPVRRVVIIIIIIFRRLDRITTNCCDRRLGSVSGSFQYRSDAFLVSPAASLQPINSEVSRVERILAHRQLDISSNSRSRRCCEW